jgi:hypothetical protein
VTNVGVPTVAVMIALLNFAVILMLIGQIQLLFGFLMLKASSDDGVRFTGSAVAPPC